MGTALGGAARRAAPARRTACDRGALALGARAGGQAAGRGAQARQCVRRPAAAALRAQAASGGLQARQAQPHAGQRKLAGRQVARQRLHYLALPAGRRPSGAGCEAVVDLIKAGGARLAAGDAAT